MAAYTYVAINLNGVKEKGVISADNPEIARRELRNRKLTPVKIKKASNSLFSSFFPKKISLKNLVLFTRQMHALLLGGVALDRALKVIGEQSLNATLNEQLEAELAETLSGEGPFTVFAPTNDAFAAALEALGITAEDLLASPDLGGILTYHVVAGKLMAADVISAIEAGYGTALVETVNGASITVEVVDGNVVIDGAATVISTDLEAGNGVVHVIDAVILPPSN